MEKKLDAGIVNRIRMKFMLRPDGENRIREYLQAVEELRIDNSLSLEDKLRRLIAPLLDMLYDDSPRFDSHVRVIDQDHIDLKNEIDTEDLHYDYEKYDIQDPINTGTQWLLETDVPAISLSEKYSDYLDFCRDVEPVTETEFENIYKNAIITTTDESTWKRVPDALICLPERMTFKEVHDLWLPTLTEKTIIMRDLLQQILVAYTIKRAQNGHEPSAHKLFSLFENQVKFERREDRIVLKRRTVKNIKRLMSSTLHVDLENVDRYDQDIIQTARGYLWHILTGFNPRQIVDGIVKENESRPVPTRIKKFYLRYFAEQVPKELLDTMHQLSRCEVIISQCERTMRQLESLSGKIPDADERLKKLENAKRQVEWTMFDLGITVDTLLNPYHPIMEGYWADGDGKAHMFNSYCYRPNKRGNLTVWLFGPEGSPEYGRVNQLVRDELYGEIRQYLTTEHTDAPELDRSESGEIGDEDIIQRLPSNDDITDVMQSVEHRDLAARAFDYLKREEFSDRDIKIFFDRIHHDASADDLERAHGVGARQQQKIVKKIQAALKKAFGPR